MANCPNFKHCYWYRRLPVHGIFQIACFHKPVDHSHFPKPVCSKLPQCWQLLREVLFGLYVDALVFIFGLPVRKILENNLKCIYDGVVGIVLIIGTLTSNNCTVLRYTCPGCDGCIMVHSNHITFVCEKFSNSDIAIFWLNCYVALPEHDNFIRWGHFPRYWPFVRGIHRSPIDSPHKGQWRGALILPLICVLINGWANNREAGDFRRHRAHYDVIVIDKRSVIPQFDMFLINLVPCFQARRTFCRASTTSRVKVSSYLRLSYPILS